MHGTHAPLICASLRSSHGTGPTMLARVSPLRRPWIVVVAIGLLTACTGGSPAARAPTTRAVPQTAVAPPIAATIPQPPMSRLNQRTRRRLAPDSERIDLAAPTFSHPTRIDNPLFPIGELRSA